MEIPTFDYEKRVFESGLLPIGIDEAGRGPLAGPVVAAAVLYKKIDDRGLTLEIDEEDKRWKLVRDSKKLSEKQRETAYALVQEFFHVGVGIIGPETIDRVNILQATFLAMKAALADLKKHLGKEEQQKLIILIDGNQEIPNLSLKQEAIVNGDGLVRSIAAASIVAKVTRDRIIVAADALFPGYGLAEHKGYGTAAHMAALRKLGPSPIHRMSFRPVQLAIPENVNQRFANVLKPRKSERLAKS